MVTRGDIHAGMKVRSSDGKRLGRVLVCDEGTFVIEKRSLSRVNYIACYDDVAALAAEEIVLSRPRRELACVRSDPMGGGPHSTYGSESVHGRFLW